MGQAKKQTKPVFSLEKLKEEYDAPEEKKQTKAVEGRIFETAFYQEFLNLQKREKSLLEKEKARSRTQLEGIREELKALIRAVSGLKKETEKAVKEEIINPGAYHQNFLEKVRTAIIFLREKVEDSTTWLALFNKRKGKKNHYWAQMKQLGTKYSQSFERTPAQVG